ncbi:Uncharacterized protein DAT39_002440 [Clarias magur]|uniref:Uncharacterized protein n=1 Tax=Clarias magur TaxID=1594786 RepID=A0A8J4UEH7_CLAMG|nr:Uncharacterized protein DAT39_002440 [Clarias magur]
MRGNSRGLPSQPDFNWVLFNAAVNQCTNSGDTSTTPVAQYSHTVAEHCKAVVLLS